MPSWPAKDPDAVLDYVYRIPLDAGDSIAAKANVTFERIAGTVAIDSYDIAAAPDTTDEGFGQDVAVWLSGGADGETSVFRIGWTTVETRENDDIITLPVIESDVAVPLALTGYAKPAAAHLIMRYAAFSAVPAATIAYWLQDAERYVTSAWGEGDYAAGLMSLAAHNLSLAGYGSSGSLASIPKGVSRFKSGTLDVTLTDAAANGQGYGSTPYGSEYAILLRRNRGGPFVTPTGATPDGIAADVWP